MVEVEVVSREANHVTNRVGHMASMLVGVVPLTVLSLGDEGMGLHDVVMDELEARCGRWVGGVNEEGGREERVMAMIEEEGRETSGGRDGVVVRELQQGKDNVPLVGGGVNERPKHLLDGAVGTLGLAIGLGMICSGEGESGAEVLMESLPKGTCKAGVTVGHYGLGESMELENVREEERGKRWSINIGGGGDEVTHLGEAVHHGEDRIVAKGCHGEGCDEVHGDAFPRFGGDGEGLEEAGGALMARLHHLARVT